MKRFDAAGVEFIVIGGVAVMFHGSSLVTQDVDFCAPLNHDNLAKILVAVEGLNARHFTRPDLPVIANNPSALPGLKNLYLRTDLGRIDILGELPGIGRYEEIHDKTVWLTLDGMRTRVLDLETLIAAKRHAGRTRDLIAINHLEEIRHRSGRPMKKPK